MTAMETRRTSGLSLFRMGFDASSCYDRIILRIASLAGRSYGQHQALCIIHGTFLQLAKYKLKTYSKQKLVYRTRNIPTAACIRFYGTAISSLSGLSSLADCSMPRWLELTTPPSSALTAPFSFRCSWLVLLRLRRMRQLFFSKRISPRMSFSSELQPTPTRFNDLLCCSKMRIPPRSLRVFCCWGSCTSNYPPVAASGSERDQKSLRHPSSIYLVMLSAKRWDATNHLQAT
jgi:hypothetical protein